MTDPIKRSGPGPVDPQGGAGEVGGADQPRSEAFREALETQRADAAAAPAAVSGDLQRLAEDVRAGRVTPEQVIDALVARQLASGAAALLPPPQRAQLEALLRSRLAEDPTLVSMGLALARAGEPGAR